MKKGRQKRKIIIIVVACIVALAAFGVLLYLDYSNSHEVMKLGRYTGLTVTASAGKSAEEAIVEEIVNHSRFGRAMDRKIEEKYDEAMKHFTDEAEFYKLSLSAYLEKYFKTTEKEFRETVRKTAEETARETAVLLEIAKKENLVITDEEFRKKLPEVMESYGYTDEKQFAADVNFDSLREEMLQDKVREYLMTKNTAQ